MNTQADIRWMQRFDNYAKAVKLLERGLALSAPDVFQQQGVIQGFEMTLELAWKTLQDYLAEVKGYQDVTGPRPVLEQAFADGIIEDGETWLDMLKSRNLTTQLYDEALVLEILSKVSHRYRACFNALMNFFTYQING